MYDHLRGRAYLCMSAIQALFSLYYLYTGCFQASSKRFAHVGAERQTNITYIHTCIHTYIHTYTHTLFIKQFQETRCAPGLKTLTDFITQVGKPQKYKLLILPKLAKLGVITFTERCWLWIRLYWVPNLSRALYREGTPFFPLYNYITHYA